jgi:hypothetical protein
VNSQYSIAFSKEADSLPITQTRVSEKPCFDPFYQTSDGFYQLEMMQYNQCPVDTNSGLMYDPRFT